MNSLYRYLICLTLFILSVPYYLSHQTYSWGFFGHKKINRMAVFTLPPEMIKFYKQNIEYITEHAVDPDKRRYSTEGEAARHYIDIDHYVHNGEDPFEVMPKKWYDAVDKFTEDTLQAYGIVPWHVNVMVMRLTKAFEAKDYDQILRTSADLGHYIGDSHVPLHTTKNYNGQLTGQRGIHGFWESRIPELKAKDYDYFVGRAKYVDNILEDEWETVKQSFGAKDSVLDLERQLNEEFPADQKYTFENRGSVLMKTYSEEYASTYNKMLNGMIERRLTKSIITVGSYWYTAWVNAGQPNLNNLLEKQPSEQIVKEDNELEKLYKSNKIKGREHQD
ncbi:MAG: zinc dependent phospholipase C family protein [Flavobacteriales bacterium]|nr:zinc dependent phospholipase C family protein [Flavobacteriales bacterium]MCB9364977.1 zinc dependent phospholipase C family protein [Flavobacteriales bacterium]